MFRDALHTKYRSSTKAKFARKKAKQITERRDSTSSSSSSMAESIQSMVSTLSSSSAETYASDYAAKIFGEPCPMNSEKAEPAILKPLNDYLPFLSSYLGSCPNQQHPRNNSAPLDFCVMPMQTFSAPQPIQFDDIPDDLSGIFDDF